MKKFILLFLCIVFALAFDGTLSKDIFDYRIHSVSGWMGFGLLVGILLTLVWADSDNKNQHK